MDEHRERVAVFLCGLFGLALVAGSARSIVAGEVRMRRFQTPLSEAWPIVLLLGVIGLTLVVGCALVLFRTRK